MDEEALFTEVTEPAAEPAVLSGFGVEALLAAGYAGMLLGSLSCST